MKKIIGYVFIGILLLGTIYFLLRNRNDNQAELSFVEVQKGNISEKAQAVGTIEPENEIKVKSAISGIVSDVYFKIGDPVEQGMPLLKVSPNPTPLEYAEASRNMEVAEVLLNQSDRERKRMLDLFKSQLVPKSEMDAIEAQYNEMRLRYSIAKERFELLEKGRIKLSNKNINSIIKSPIAGIILSQNVYRGDPVVPLTNFQPGTELCAIADMKQILFKGTVDEIDVGKLEPGMPVDIQIGALPDTKVEGKLDRISPKAKKEGNATLFDIEISIVKVSGKPLRAGYSATAYIIIEEQNDVIVIPERLVLFEKEKRFVEVKEGEGIIKKEVKTGLSDSLNIEIVEGLRPGEQLVERPPREIE